MRTAPSMRHCAFSQGSRTSTRTSFSPLSRRCFSSAAEISRSFIGLRIPFSRLLLGHKKIAQQYEHHEEHDRDYQAPEEKACEFGWSWSRHGLFPFPETFVWGLCVQKRQQGYRTPNCT